MQFLVESLSDSTIYMAYYLVAHFLQGGVIDGRTIGPSGIKPEQCTNHFWDAIMLGKMGDYEAVNAINKVLALMNPDEPRRTLTNPDWGRECDQSGGHGDHETDAPGG